MAITLSAIGRYTTTSGSSEIPAFDPLTQRTFIVSGTQFLNILDTSNPASPTLFRSLDTSAIGTANSVAVKNGLVAVALENPNRQAPGTVAFYDVDGNFLSSVTVGAVPDMLTFTPDGTKVLVANEGEPNSYNQLSSFDPEGSVSIIDLSGGVLTLSQSNVTTADFTAFNSQKATLIAQGVRIFGPNASVAQDLEPEYITVSSDSSTAWITLQENNAIATLNIQNGQITTIRALGFKDHNTSGNGLDASDRDSGINIQNWPVLGMYQPDAIASFVINGKTYLITANEGDARDYTGFSEEARVSSLTLDPTAFPNGATLKNNANLGRLNVTRALGNPDSDSDYDQLYAFGARSFSIWTDQGTLVFDSGDQLEQITATQVPTLFNSNGDIGTFDTRSDNKGPEPEGVVTGVIDGKTYAFIGLERTGGVMVYDVSNPNSPTFVQYITTPDDVAPEGLAFVASEFSPTGKPLLIVSYEVSGTTTFFEISTQNGQGYQPVINGTPDDNELRGRRATFYGFGGKDKIQARGGNNNLYGGDGDDDLDVDFGRNILNGGEGNDRLTARNGNNLFYGGTGKDWIRAGFGDNVIYGGDGNDVIFASGGKNLILAGSGDDIIYGGYGVNWVDAGTGYDFIWLNGAENSVVLGAGNGTDVLYNFKADKTTFGLKGGLTAADLTVKRTFLGTLIEITATGEDLAFLAGTRISSPSVLDFVTV
jgi:Ca2+-binding RTX toxin-like protein